MPELASEFYLNFRIGKAPLDRGFVGNGDKESFSAHCATCASAKPRGADLPASCHGLNITQVLAASETAPAGERQPSVSMGHGSEGR